MQQQQRTALCNLEEKNSFLHAYQSAKKERHEIGSKHAKAVIAGLKKYPAALPLNLDQTNVKKLIPNGSVCWRGNVRGEWWGRLRPYKSFHEKLVDYATESDCMKAMVKKLWHQWCEKEGLEAHSTCPISGIF